MDHNGSTWINTLISLNAHNLLRFGGSQKFRLRIRDSLLESLIFPLQNALQRIADSQCRIMWLTQFVQLLAEQQSLIRSVTNQWWFISDDSSLHKTPRVRRSFQALLNSWGINLQFVENRQLKTLSLFAAKQNSKFCALMRLKKLFTQRGEPFCLKRLALCLEARLKETHLERNCLPSFRLKIDDS